jgi:1-acyl-sn-glycerol-3-phosphate acyltransferase
MSSEVGPVRRALGRTWLKVFGWKAVGPLPEGVPKAVFVAAPHTSNWDGPHMIAIAWTLGVPLHWMGKKELFRFPFERFLKSVGGVSVDRSRPEGVVEDIARAFAAERTMYLAIAPSGSRRGKGHVKSGFYRIAQQAGVPIVLGFLDYEKRQGGCGPVVVPTGNLSADMEHLRAFYATVVARHPERVPPMRVREEAGGPADAAG